MFDLAQDGLAIDRVGPGLTLSSELLSLRQKRLRILDATPGPLYEYDATDAHKSSLWPKVRH